MNQPPPRHPTYAPESGTARRWCAAERWSFVRCKQAQRWRWWVGEATTGQVVAFVSGRRTHATFRRLLAVLAQAGWAVEPWFTDAWGACEAGLPAEQRPTGKAPMQRLERKPLTLRTRLKRLARKTSCFSKKQFFHDGLITLFLVHFLF